jgi:ATP/maltotriose-dependent transcriptional regulator MalT
MTDLPDVGPLTGQVRHVMIVSQLLRRSISPGEPRLSVDKLKPEEKYAEILTSDLPFDAMETAKLLGTDPAQKLGRRGVWRPVKATEGWPTAIQLARIALFEGRRPAAQIRGLSGASPNIAEYLEDPSSRSNRHWSVYSSRLRCFRK